MSGWTSTGRRGSQLQGMAVRSYCRSQRATSPAGMTYTILVSTGSRIYRRHCGSTSWETASSRLCGLSSRPTCPRRRLPSLAAGASLSLPRLCGASAAEAIGNRHLLVLLDNFEHVIAAAPDVATLLVDCPHLEVLATSRERLSLQGEHVYPVQPLARKDSLELFLARARAIAPDFEPDGRLDELCARLDDLPLAIELSAARTSLMTVDQLLERLGSRLDLLRAGRDAEARHQTLRTTIEWSFDLLSPDERRLLAALSVFRGGWKLDTSEKVADASFNLLGSLVDKSLVRRSDIGRFGMLDTVRDFAAEHLGRAERSRIEQRLMEVLLNLFANAELSEDATGHMQIDLAAVEHPNIDVALSWAGESGHAQMGIRLLLLTEMYWITTDPDGGRARLERLLAKISETGEPL